MSIEIMFLKKFKCTLSKHGGPLFDCLHKTLKNKRKQIPLQFTRCIMLSKMTSCRDLLAQAVRKRLTRECEQSRK